MLKRWMLIACTLLALSAALPAAAERHVIVIGAAPPPLRIEHAPAHRRGHVWAPGHWHWNGHRHVWNRGHWVRARIGHRWAASGWDERGGRYYFRRGHWERGG